MDRGLVTGHTGAADGRGGADANDPMDERQRKEHDKHILRVTGGGPGWPSPLLCYGWIALMRVAQLASAVRVPPHVVSCSHSSAVHDWAMYSFAIQIVPPSATAAE